MAVEKADPVSLFTRKAETYDRFRWDYAPKAIKYILVCSGIDSGSSVADIGSGTGILTKHFIDKVRVVYAVEPNSSMRSLADIRHSAHPTFQSIARRAESTGLKAQSLDLVVVGQALHWFDPDRTPIEFSRILKPDGWLAVIWNKLGQGVLTRSLDEVFSQYMGDNRRRTEPELLLPYFQSADYQHQSFSVGRYSKWDQFIGGLLSASWAPDASDSDYSVFKEDARGIFERFKSRGKIKIEVVSHVAIGQPNANQLGMS